MTDLSTVQQTQTLGSVTTTPAPEKTRTISEIVEDAGFLRNQSRTINEDINDLHHEAIGFQFFLIFSMNRGFRGERSPE